MNDPYVLVDRAHGTVLEIAVLVDGSWEFTAKAVTKNKPQVALLLDEDSEVLARIADAIRTVWESPGLPVPRLRPSHDWDDEDDDGERFGTHPCVPVVVASAFEGDLLAWPACSGHSVRLGIDVSNDDGVRPGLVPSVRIDDQQALIDFLTA